MVLVLSWKEPDGLGEGYEWAEAEEGDATTAGEDIDAGLQILHWSVIVVLVVTLLLVILGLSLSCF